MAVNEELKLLRKCKKSWEGEVFGRGRGGEGGRLVRLVVNEELKLLLKCKKKKSWGWSGWGEGGQGGCERRIELILTMQKTFSRDQRYLILISRI